MEEEASATKTRSNKKNNNNNNNQQDLSISGVIQQVMAPEGVILSPLIISCSVIMFYEGIGFQVHFSIPLGEDSRSNQGPAG